MATLAFPSLGRTNASKKTRKFSPPSSSSSPPTSKFSPPSSSSSSSSSPQTSKFSPPSSSSSSSSSSPPTSPSPSSSSGSSSPASLRNSSPTTTVSQLSGDSGVGSEEELSCPVFDLLKQGQEEEEEGPLYENLALNSPALSLPPPVQVHHFIAIFFQLV